MLVDLLHLSRNLRRSPASAAAAIMTLALTLGAGASIIAVVDAVLLTPPPFTDPDTLVVVSESPMAESAATTLRTVGYATFEAWRDRAGSLAQLEALDGTNLTLTELGAAERVNASNVTPGFLPLLGVTPVLGRSFDRDDVGRPVVVISHGFWRTKLAADPAAIGRQLVLGARAHTIIGVLPEHFSFDLNACDVWRPFPVTAAQAVRSGYRVNVIARLARQRSATELRGALDDISRTSSPPARVVATPIATAIAGDATSTLGLLAGAAALAMLVAFTNLAGLLIVRSIDRRRELAVRRALGAHRYEITKQLLLESASLVVVGIVAGALLAWWITPAVGRVALEQFGALANRDVAVSGRVIGAIAIVALGCAGMTGLLPALLAARWSVIEVLRRGATPPPREGALRRVFVTGEVALAFVLLLSVSLLGRSLFGVLTTSPGLDARGVLTLSVSLPQARYTDGERVASFYSALQRALEERFGARAIAIIDELPLTGDRGRGLVGDSPTDAGREVVVRTAGPGYFDVMRIPIAAGRSFDSGDDASAPVRVVVSGAVAQRLFASEPVIGRHVWLARTAQAAEVIGVAGEVKHRALDEALLPTVYLSALQAPSHSNIVVVRSPRATVDVIAAVREEVARLDRDLPVYTIRSMADVVAMSPGVPARRVLTAAFAAFTILALVLAAIGLFGVVAHDVACRRTELALRLALGADPARILSATLGQGAVMVGSGLVLGGVLSLWVTRTLGSMVVATAGFDIVSAGVAAALLVIVGAAAVLPAARRAARTDPLVALRNE